MGNPEVVRMAAIILGVFGFIVIGLAIGAWMAKLEKRNEK